MEMRTIENKEDIPALAEAQKYVEGWVEKLELPNGDVLLFNEEGRMKGLDLNEEATALVNSFDTVYPTTILGNVILLPKALNQKRW